MAVKDPINPMRGGGGVRDPGRGVNSASKQGMKVDGAEGKTGDKGKGKDSKMRDPGKDCTP